MALTLSGSKGGSSPQGASQLALVGKNSSAMQETHETPVRSLGREDPLQEGMVTHSGILASRTVPPPLFHEESGGL